VYFCNILNWQKCHGLMMVDEYYQEYISWSVDITMRIQNLYEWLNI